ncbi:hypothetical protein OE88DRAFT_1666653 [Heliocybe sulcata]|uniref:Conserved oligomeric Golgi complex subunit 7 n=1 Tax=Heliocybe sulcata TaxID=5364 RepID=A0A5C3MPF5_9AGAM|nr:hypothetical protein OE88DRAFT_1666653 [Heliocybe sulcata]
MTSVDLPDDVDLDLTAWVNSVVSLPADSDSPSDLATLDKHLASLTASLEVAVEESSSLLGRLIDDVSRSVPRLTYDLHFMREGSLGLQSTLSGITRTTATGEHGTKEVLDKLTLLDTMKTNMTEARAVLGEAESWSMLEPEVTALLSDNHFLKAAERLSEASENLFVFQNTPEYEARRGVVVSLENQLEAGVSAALVSAINSRDTQSCRSYYEIFARIQREAEFFNYYVGARTEAVGAAWQQLCTSPSFADSLPSFFHTIHTLLQLSLPELTQIFPSPRQTLTHLISSILSSLSPSFSQKISELANDQSPEAVSHLVSAYKATESFALEAYKTLHSLDSSTAPTNSETLPRRSSDKLHARRHSRRMSISTSLTSTSLSAQAHGQEEEWDLALFTPFLDAQTSYSSLEKKYLDSRLSVVGLSGGNGDVSRTLRDWVESMAREAEGAVCRCLEFTHGYSLPGLLATLDFIISEFLQSLTTQISSSTSLPSSHPSTATADLFDLDYTPADYARIQSLLHILESIRSALDRIAAVEVHTRGAMSKALGENDITRADGVLPGMTPGEQRLLAESGLNTAALHTLLEFLTPTPPSQPPSQALSHSHSQPHHPSISTDQEPSPLLPSSRRSITALAATAQKSLQDVILSPLLTRLQTYPSLPVFTSPSTHAGGAGELKIPTFSLSPTDTMQRVAEGLLNMPRLFEVYADDDVLAFCAETLPYAGAEAAKVLSDSLQGQNQLGHSHSQSQLSSHARSGSLALPKAKPAPHLSAETILSLWLTSLGRSFLTHLLGEVLPRIGRLSEGGRRQLGSDLGYLETIVQALNVDVDIEEDGDGDREREGEGQKEGAAGLRRWRELVEMADMEGRDAERDEVWRQVARMRGWP